MFSIPDTLSGLQEIKPRRSGWLQVLILVILRRDFGWLKLWGGGAEGLMALGKVGCQWTKVIITAAEQNLSFACALPTKNLKICLKQHFEISSDWSITFCQNSTWVLCVHLRKIFLYWAKPVLETSPSLIPNQKSWTKILNSRLNPQTRGQSVAVVCIVFIGTCNLRSWSNTDNPSCGKVYLLWLCGFARTANCV